MATEIDPVTFEVIKNAMDSIADEMALVIMRSAHSAVCRDSLDYSTAIMDGQGRMAAQGLLTPLHMGSFPYAMQVLLEHYEGQMEPGDLFISNDPYGGGGMHLPDIYVIKPIFFEGRIEGYATTLVHHTDIGGITPGGTAVHATEIYQEGLRIPLLKLFDKGEPNDAIFKFIEKNVRVPKKVMGDLRGQIAACATAEKHFLELIQKYGSPTLGRYLNEMQDYAERVMRDELKALPNGTYENTEFIDGFGEEPEPIVFHVKLTIEEDEVTADWTGTSPQVKAAINAPGPWARSATYVALRCLVRADIPNSEGYMRPIKVITEPGSILNPHLPGAANARGITGFRIIDTVHGALAKAVPERIPAAPGGGLSNCSIGGLWQGEPFVFTEGIGDTWGGSPDRDGIDGISPLAANQTNQPIEMVESENPIEVLCYGFLQDSGGPGKYRGGLAYVREWRLLADEAIFTIRSDRRYHLPYGLAGGKSGTPSWNILNPGPNQKVLPVLPRESTELKKGDSVRHNIGGAGGYGDPLERDPQLVLEDVRDEKLSIDYVRREYGVVIDPYALTVDENATRRLRREMATDSSARPHAESHVEHFVRSLGLDPRLRRRVKTTKALS
jgi:N-methylhydantoinase B